ncbi:MAG: hypothetical protein VB996_14425, partial [Pseudomonadales bacterium]
RLTRVHEYRKAFDLIQIFQKENHNNLDEHLYARLCEWDDKRLTAMLGLIWRFTNSAGILHITKLLFPKEISQIVQLPYKPRRN